MADLDGVAAQYRDFAGWASGQSACFESWATEVAADESVLTWIAALPEPKRQPNLVFAAARWNGVIAPGPYAGLRSALLGDGGAIRDTVMSRSTQTNEVGRLATLEPAFELVAQGRAVALLEVGASAGLCLYPDRYDYDWGRAGWLTGSGGPILRCAVRGDLPVPIAPLKVGWRGGIDLNPLDVADEQDMSWLAMLVWPEDHTRRSRLTDAIAIARTDPPALVPGDLLDRLSAQVDEAAEHGLVIVFHSAVISYLTAGGRRAFAALMEDLVARGRCRWVSNEGPRVLPQVTGGEPTTTTGSSYSFVLGIDGQAVARTHQHGAAMDWL